MDGSRYRTGRRVAIAGAVAPGSMLKRWGWLALLAIAVLAMASPVVAQTAPPIPTAPPAGSSPAPIFSASPPPTAVQSELTFYEGIFTSFISFSGWNQNAIKTGQDLAVGVIVIELGMFLYFVWKTIASNGPVWGFIVEILYKVLAMTILVSSLSFIPAFGQNLATYPCIVAGEVTGAQTSTSGQTLAGGVNDCATIAQPFGMFQEGWAVFRDVQAIKLPDGSGGWFNWFSSKITDVALKMVMYSCAISGMLALWFLAFINLACLACLNASIPICAIFLPLMLFQFFAQQGRSVLTFLFTSAEMLFGYYLGCFIGIALINKVVTHLESLAYATGGNSVVNGAVTIADLGVWAIVGPVVVLAGVVAEVLFVMWLVQRVAKGSPFDPSRLAGAIARFAGGVAAGVATGGTATAAMALNAAKGGASGAMAKVASGIKSKFGRHGSGGEHSPSFVSKLRDRMNPSKRSTGGPTASTGAAEKAATSRESAPRRDVRGRTSATATTKANGAEGSEADSGRPAPVSERETGTPSKTITGNEKADETGLEEGAVVGDLAKNNKEGTPEEAIGQDPLVQKKQEARGQEGAANVSEEAEQSSTSGKRPVEQMGPVVTLRSRGQAPGLGAQGAPPGPSVGENPEKRPVELMTGISTLRARGNATEASPGMADAARRATLGAKFRKAASFVDRQLTPGLDGIRRGVSAGGHAAFNGFRQGFGKGYRFVSAVQKHGDVGAFAFDKLSEAIAPPRPVDPAVAHMSNVARSLDRLSGHLANANAIALRSNMGMQPPQDGPPGGGPSTAPPPSDGPHGGPTPSGYPAQGDPGEPGGAPQPNVVRPDISMDRYTQEQGIGGSESPPTPQRPTEGEGQQRWTVRPGKKPTLRRVAWKPAWVRDHESELRGREG